MKKFALILFAILEVASVNVFAQGINFESNINLKKLQEKAKKENKLIFIDCYTSWCGPCKWMAKNIFTNDTVASYYNANFICAQIDMEKGEGPEIGKRFDVNCYPTYLFIDSDGKLVHRRSSTCNTQEFIKIASDALIPEKNYAFFQKKYDDGSISRNELISYMGLRQASGLGNKDEVKKYFSISGSGKIECQDWAVIRDFGVDIHSLIFKSLISNRDTFYSLHTEDSVNNVIGNSYLQAMYKCFFGNRIDTIGYEKLRGEVISLNLSFLDQIVVRGDLGFYERTANWKRYANTAILFIDRYLPKGDQEFYALNDIAWAFFEHIDNGIYLNLATEWARRSVELFPAYVNLDTYASLLYKRGKKVEAQVAAEKAVELEKKIGQKIPETEALLNKIKAMK